MCPFTELMEDTQGLTMRKDEEQETLNTLQNLRTSLQLMASHAIQFR